MHRDSPEHGSARAALHRWYSRSGNRFRKRSSRVSYRWELAHRAAPDHDSARVATEWRNSRSGSRFRKPSPFAYRWGLLSRAASDHVSARAAPHRWYSHNESRFRKHHSRVSYKWGLLLCSMPNYVSVRAALCGWYSHNESRYRKHPSRFPYSWGLLHRDAPNHDYLGLFRRIPRRIFRRFCLWCRWAFRYRRYVPLNTKHCHRCGSSGIQLHKPYDCSNHIFCIRGSHVSPHSHSFCSAPWLFLPPLLTRSPVSGTPLPAPSNTGSAIFSYCSLLVIKPCYPFRSNCTDSDASTASTTFRASASISISATKAMTCSRSCAGTCSALRLMLRNRRILRSSVK